MTRRTRAVRAGMAGRRDSPEEEGDLATAREHRSFRSKPVLIQRAAILAGVVLILPSSPGSLPGQTPASPETLPTGPILGRVIDAETRSPLRGAALTLKRQSLAGASDGRVEARPGGAPPATVVTDSAGHYRFENLRPGIYAIEITRLGYHPAAVTVDLAGGDPTSVSVGLQVRPIVLRPLSSRAAASVAYARDLPTAIRVESGRTVSARARQRAFLTSDVRALTHDDVLEAGTLGETDLFRAFQRLPGVGTRDDFNTELWVRGAPWDRTRVYLDGLPLFNPLHGGGVLSGVNTDAVGAAFFQPGVRPARLGEGAAGTIDLTTRSAGAEPGTRGFGELSLASLRLSLYRRLSEEGAGVLLAARRSYLDWLVGLVAGPGDAFPYSLFDLTGRLDLPLGERTALEASGLWQGNRVDGDVPDVLQGNRGSWGNTMSRVTLRAPIRGLRTRHTLGMTRYGMDLDEVPPDPETGERFTASSLQATESDLLHLVLKGSARPSSPGAAPEAAWTFGYELIHRRQDHRGAPPSFHPIPVVPDTVSFRESHFHGTVWGERRWRPVRPLEIRGGLRVEAGEAGPGPAIRLAPRLSARWTMTPRLGLSAAAGRSYQYVQAVGPAGEETAVQLRPGHVWMLAGDRTSPLRSDLGTLGAEYWLDREWLAGVSLYLRRSADLLLPEPRTGPIEDRPALVPGRETARGAELSLRKLAGRWTMSLSYTYARAESEADGRTFPSGPDRRHLLDLTSMLRVGTSLRIGTAFSAGSGAPFTRFFTASSRTDPDSGERIVVEPTRVGAPNARRGPGYASLDLLLDGTFRFESWSLEPYLQVRNVLNAGNGRTYLGSSGCGEGGTPCQDGSAGVRDRFEQGIPLLPLIGFRVAF